MRAHGLGRPEASGIVDCRCVGQRDDRADAGGGHQQPRAAILAREGSKALLQLLPLLEKRPACREQRLGQRRQRWVVGDQFANSARKALRRRRADLQPEAAEHAAQAHLDVIVFGLQQLACRQQRSHPAP